MFSNSNDVFRTQADTRFNSFADPLNSVNQNGGGWGIDPNYLTPSYTSPFRPQYQGPNGNTYGRGSPSFGQAFNQVVNPFAGGGSNYGGNYWQQTAPYYDSLVNRPMDGAASFAQNWAVPGLATFAAYKYLGKGADRLGGAFGAGVTRGLFGLMGSGAQAGTAMTAGRALGAMGGSLFLPALAAQGASMAFDSAIADPYIAQRQMGRSLRDNFSGINFGEGVGDRYTGGGMSRKFAQGLAGQISAAGARDMTFTQQETSQLTDLSSRAGLLDNTSASQMSSRFEGIMKQVKVVMAIANTSDFKETIEIMSKMQMSGVNPNQLSGAMGRMAAMAGAGGQSMQKMLNTVGAQGQYMFGAAGLTPYEGTMSAFGASAAHSAAFRSGLLSPAMMARMGGIEGASQSSVAGTIGMYSTPYAGMMASNAYRGGGETGNVVTNMSQFGGRVAGNPLQAIGSHRAMGRSMISKMIGERGVQGEQDMIYQYAQQIPGGVGKNGKVTSEVAYLIMTEYMGLSPESATAKLSEYSALISPKTSAAMLAGADTASVNALSKYRQQEGLDKGIFTTPYNAVKHGLMAVQETGALGVSGALSRMGAVGDSIEDTVNRTLFGVKPSDNGLSLDKAVSLNKGTKIYDISSVSFAEGSGAGRGNGSGGAAFGGRGRGSAANAGLAQINKALMEGDPDAQKFMSATGYEKQQALDRLVRKGKVDQSYNSSSKANELVAAADKAKTRDYNEGSVYGTDNGSPESILKSKLDKVLPGGSASQAISYITLSDKIYGIMKDGGDVSAEDRAAYARSMGVDVNTLTPQKMRELSANGVQNANWLQVAHLAGMDIGESGTIGDIVGKIKSTGAQLLSPQIGGSDVSAIKTQSDVQKGIAKDRSRLLSLSKNGRIDDSTYMNGMSALDNKETVGKFAEAVDKFVGGVNGAKPANGVANPNGVPSMKEYFFDGKRIQKN